jgi:hypothetical protein
MYKNIFYQPVKNFVVPAQRPPGDYRAWAGARRELDAVR